GAVAENESWSQKRGGVRKLWVYLGVGGDVASTKAWGVGFSDGLHGRRHPRARPALVVDPCKWWFFRLAFTCAVSDHQNLSEDDNWRRYPGRTTLPYRRH